jgi:hypothetical protein
MSMGTDDSASPVGTDGDGSEMGEATLDLRE